MSDENVSSRREIIAYVIFVIMIVNVFCLLVFFAFPLLGLPLIFSYPLPTWVFTLVLLDFIFLVSLFGLFLEYSN